MNFNSLIKPTTQQFLARLKAFDEELKQKQDETERSKILEDIKEAKAAHKRELGNIYFGWMLFKLSEMEDNHQ